MTADILLVEDDHPTRLALAYQLTYAGYRVSEAANGEEALSLLDQTAFACVLTDVVLGRVDGLAVLHAARSQPYRPSVILLTGYGSLETSITALREGALDYLLKPCTQEQLMASVREGVKRHTTEQQLRASALQLLTALTTAPEAVHDALGTPPVQEAVPPAFIEVGPLVIGVSRREVWFNGQALLLTPIEYALLRLLAMTPGQVRRYCEIVRHTHGLETDEADAQQLLRTHIRNLRRKIPPTWLVTDRGMGVMLTDAGETTSVPVPQF